ncbi:transcriptional regulator, partial [Pseudomonas aeruginosa]
MLMFSQAETEALVLGMRWVSRRARQLAVAAAGQALAKIAAVLPPALREELEANTLLIAPVQAPPVADELRVLI